MDDDDEIWEPFCVDCGTTYSVEDCKLIPNCKCEEFDDFD
mgnify:CR=1 FL=1